VAYKNEGFDMFTSLMNGIWEEFARYIFHVEVEIEGQNGDQAEQSQPWAMAGGSATSTAAYDYAGGHSAAGREAIAAAAGEAGAMAASADGEGDVELLPEVETRRVDEREQVGRNEPCWCGSGKKFKKCHGA
jgi:preprotein translocase subunit SecA